MKKPIKKANYITAPESLGSACPIFRKKFRVEKEVAFATLHITALGLYEAEINGKKIGEFRLAPGFTSYKKRLQYQTYDITEHIRKNNTLDVCVGSGWCVGRMGWGNSPETYGRWSKKRALIAALEIVYIDGTIRTIYTDESWKAASSGMLLSEIYDGEVFDSNVVPKNWKSVEIYEYTKDNLIPQEGEIVREICEIKPARLFKAPNGETVIDFGQEFSGYVRFKVCGRPGDICDLDHAEVLDAEGNFYTENLRSAKQNIRFICNGNPCEYRPHFTFQGFRYVRVNSWPEEINPDNFTGVVICSDIKRTGYFRCSNEKLNRLYENVIWGQMSNFIDIPTDCPQRDERLGWTGDAQVFCATAALNFDVERFFEKWLADLAAEQGVDGSLPHVVPDVLDMNKDRFQSSCGWGDAATVCPWNIYLAYGSKKLLRRQFESMRRWVEYIRGQGSSEYLWDTGRHYSDWLALDVDDPKNQRGATEVPLVATAFYAYSTSILIKAGKALGKDMSEYEKLHRSIVKAFNERFVKGDRLTSDTQTAYVLALHFDLVEDKPRFAARIAELIEKKGTALTTGFLGTAYLLETLSENGYTGLAYSLILREEFPSWLYSVNMGATTIWEHWDGMRPDGTMWSKGMNSFNHYAYGVVAGWMYNRMAGIALREDCPGYSRFILRPEPDPRITWVEASLETRRGTIRSAWKRAGDQYEYEFTVPEGTSATIILSGKTYEVGPGRYKYTL